MRGGSRRSPGLSPWQPPLALISRRCLQARERAPDTFTELLPAAKPLPLTRAPRTASFSRDPGPVPNRTRRLLSSACSSPSDRAWFQHSSCTCVAESITHATYNRPESVPGPHSVRQSVYAVWCVPFCLDCSVPSVHSINFKRKKKTGPELQLATCTVSSPSPELSRHAPSKQEAQHS